MKNYRSFLSLFFAIFLGSLSPLFSQSLEFTKTPNGPVNFDLEVDVAKINLHVKNVPHLIERIFAGSNVILSVWWMPEILQVASRLL